MLQNLTVNKLKQAINETSELSINDYIELLRIIENQELKIRAQQDVIDGLASEENVKFAYRQGLNDRAYDYRIAMMLSIQEMLKYSEINKEQAELLYNHNYEVYRQFLNGGKQ